ncbi:MAG: hypothetical protein O1I87_14945 [Cylindrospermopsis raciborskii PAMP2012]|uniref:hypothetical protein n=1 Tax=Cylindrospermopsis raciborskii TaxID=77022 RepID=UPI000778A5C2|nr:hypothetical protein [Cylindrospermopsis raciborskii]MCZ2203222.1 hypothetical protein [Cylindrospermopsis raciborskii PAMP2012]
MIFSEPGKVGLDSRRGKGLISRGTVGKTIEKTAQQICPYPAREGKYIEHQFEFGASGLFGEETPGHWLSERAAINIYKRIFWFYKILGVQGIIYRYPLGRMLIETLNLKEPWYDTHASL